ncbi:MAG: FAD:protein FMN transferase [Bacteroidota bacterium]
MNRREFLNRSLTGGVIAVVLPWHSRGNATEPAGLSETKGGEIVVDRAVFVMGTVVRITVYARSEEQALAATSKAFSEIRRLDQLLSVYRLDSDISRINRAAGDHAAPVHPEVVGLLKSAMGLSTATCGALDITIEPLMRLWGFRESGDPRRHIPTDSEIARTLDRVGLQNLMLDGNANTAGLARRGACLDLGGIAVGYAVDRAAEILKECGIQRAFINHSGDAYALGAPPDTDGWEVVIPHPSKHGESILSMRLRDRAISTSGNYEKFVLLDGIQQGHILDPRTGTPGNGLLGISVTAPRAITADALSTGFFCLSTDRLAYSIQQTPDIEAVCVSRGSNDTLVRHLRSKPS